MTKNHEMVEVDFIEFGEPIYVWKTPCRTCGLPNPKAFDGEVPRCGRCKNLLGEDEPLRWSAAS